MSTEPTNRNAAPDAVRIDVSPGTVQAAWWVTEDPCPSWCRGHMAPRSVEDFEPIEDRLHFDEGHTIETSLHVLFARCPVLRLAAHVLGRVDVGLVQRFRERCPRVELCVTVESGGSGDEVAERVIPLTLGEARILRDTLTNLLRTVDDATAARDEALDEACSRAVGQTGAAQ